jgi:hypothetical protein
MQNNNNTHGGQRKGAGRKVRLNLHFTAKDAKEIYGLLKMKRANTPGMTEEQMLMSLVKREWSEILESYEEKAELAAEGETSYII